jgi:hypothetical protein
MMGKRSDFKRVERDFYPTPIEAVRPLIPHLPHSTTYVEPCAGDGALISHLESAGMRCVLAYDIMPKRHDIRQGDALKASRSLTLGDAIITNPPWNRKILHPMIEHFSALRPTWLLFDADWVHTKQAALFMPWLRKIVSVGRVKWIPDSKMTGKDNCAWHLFDQNATGLTEFVGRGL